MNLKLLEEIIKTKNTELDNVFEKTLKEIFNKHYLLKIKNVLKRKIKVVPVNGKGRNFYAFYSGGRTISVNRNTFFSDNLTNEQRISILAHEFIHVLQKNRRFFVKRNFKQIHELGKKLKVIVKKYTENPTLFLTGKKHITLGIGSLVYEIIPYLIMGTINWKHIQPMGKNLFLKELKDSQIFNLNSEFWKKIINK